MHLVSPRNALRFMFLLLLTSLIIVLLFSFNSTETITIFLLGFLATVLYSVPPFRLKRFTWFSNLTISIARGLLLILAGWSVLDSVFFNIEPWVVGSFFTIIIFFLVSAKDLRDIKGDEEFGIKTIPVLHGKSFTKNFLSIGFFIPGPVILLLASLNFLEANRNFLYTLAFLAFSLGIILTLVIRKVNDDEEKIWKISYLFLLILQIGLGLVYFLS